MGGRYLPPILFYIWKYFVRDTMNIILRRYYHRSTMKMVHRLEKSIYNLEHEVHALKTIGMYGTSGVSSLREMKLRICLYGTEVIDLQDKLAYRFYQFRNLFTVDERVFINNLLHARDKYKEKMKEFIDLIDCPFKF